VLITDWSGAAFEYAFATERPPLFIDLPPKVKNDAWQEIPEVPFEDRMRSEVGIVVAPDHVSGVAERARELIDSREEWRTVIGAAADRELFGRGRAGPSGAEIIEDLCRQATISGP